MALTPEQIDAEAFARWGEMKGAPLAMCRGFARAIESEVRKDYEALIQQLVEALEAGLEEVIATGECEGVLFGPDQHVDEKLQAAIAAARARLKEIAP